ncbi:phenoloxidase-activating factor 2-like [Vanessa cardui]|uniref:phenoloxidase-activating factor 2-like n=1 Tax=Vanessa cardui TaxID=171605 RepID=UPI001F13F643|nr:phenoloxidase-activating factor 2-like [Vanessa cardui]
MWIHLFPVLGWLMLCNAASDVDVSQIETFLLEIADEKEKNETVKALLPDNYKLCNHEKGVAARCVKRSLCGDKAPPVDPATTFTFREIGGTCTYLQTCCPEDKISTEPKKAKVEKKRGCGYSNPGANVLRELADKYGYADYGDFPWMIVVMKKGIPAGQFDKAYIAGGTLIDPSVVMTVAHKVDDIEDNSEIMCRAGEWDTKTDEEFFKHQDRDVKSIIIHNEYMRQKAHNDVALIFLKEPFILDGAPHIGVACLEKKLPSPGTECFSMGWGKDFVNDQMYAAILKKLKLPLVAADRCQNLYRNSQLGQSYSLHKSLTCAGGEANVDTCVGDGGSSLVCPIPDKSGLRYSVVGMVAYGLGCGTENLPGVYVKIPEVYDWVFREMVSQGYNEKFFVS